MQRTLSAAQRTRHLGAGDDVVLSRQDVHQLALALVAPLRAQHHGHLRI